MSVTYKLTALGDPRRVEILGILAQGELPVGEIARRLPVTRSAVSQHLRILKQSGWVRSRNEGARHFYAIDPSGVEEMRAFLDGLWSRALDRFQEIAEGDQR